MSKEIQKRPATLEEIFSARNAEVARLLPSNCGMDAARFIRFAIAASKTDSLRKCTPESIYEACLESAALGFPIGGPLALAYLVPYGTVAQFQLGYRGMIELLRRSGFITRGEVRAVFDGDEFEYEFGLEPKLKHRPCGNTDPNELTHVYFVARFADGATQFDVMTEREVLAVREFSKAKNAAAWSNSFAEMSKKSVVRRMCKMLPMTPEAQEAIGRDDERFTTIDAKATVMRGTLAPPQNPNALPAPSMPEAVDTRTGEVIEATAEPAQEKPAVAPLKVDDFADRFSECTTMEQVDAISKEIRAMNVDQATRAVLAKSFAAAKARVSGGGK